MSPKLNNFSSVSKNKGFLIPLAAIILVGIAILAIAISRITSQTSQSSYIEGISVQAFYAAESGAYLAMNRLLFGVIDRGVANTNCSNLSGTNINFTANGLQACDATITCTLTTAAGSPTSYYSIRSEASCGAGGIFAERIVEVSSYF